jgi:hypothetical protein
MYPRPWRRPGSNGRALIADPAAVVRPDLSWVSVLLGDAADRVVAREDRDAGGHAGVGEFRAPVPGFLVQPHGRAGGVGEPQDREVGEQHAPDGDVVTYLSHHLSVRAWPYRATVTLHRSAAELADRIWTGMGVLEAIDDASCLLHVGADTPWALSWVITSIDTDFTVTDPPALVEQIEILARRCAAAIRA